MAGGGGLEEEDVFSFVYDIDHLTIFLGVEKKFFFFCRRLRSRISFAEGISR